MKNIFTNFESKETMAVVSLLASVSCAVLVLVGSALVLAWPITEVKQAVSIGAFFTLVAAMSFNVAKPVLAGALALAMFCLFFVI